jgi:hypothetical protein
MSDRASEKMNPRIFFLSLILLSVSRLTAGAQLLNFNFSVYATFGGNVSGEIFGLEDNSTSTPSEVTVNFFHNPVHDAGGIVPAGLTFSSQNPLVTFTPDEFSDDQNVLNTDQFTVVNGQIIGGDLYANDNAGNQLSLNINYGNTDPAANNNSFESTSPGVNISADTGFSGATYTLVSSPEPSTWLMLLGAWSLLAWRLHARGKVV